MVEAGSINSTVMTAFGKAQAMLSCHEAGSERKVSLEQVVSRKSEALLLLAHQDAAVSPPHWRQQLCVDMQGSACAVLHSC